MYGELRDVKGERWACPFRWPGQYEDAETGLYYNRFRYYDAEAGQYASQDPIGLVGGAALYAYVHDPLAWLDPLGLSSCGDPQIVAGSNRDTLGQAVGHVKAHGGTAADKADLFDRLAKKQIEPLSKGSWKSTRAAGTDGSHVFLGGAGEALVIAPDGSLHRGSLQTGGVQIAGPRSFKVLYDKLRPI